jgi:potassium-transporting ATPase KdpC subunit
MRRQLLPALKAVLVFTVLTGLLYPLVVLLIGQVAFHDQADGSLVEVDGRVVGSSLIGQSFTEPQYLHPRPSAAGDGYDPSASSGSNLGPSDEGLLATVEERAVAYREENGLPADARVPVDAVTASGSGLDPHITVANARLQAPRIAEARDLPVDDVLAVIDEETTHRPLGFLGDDVVNVLRVNVRLDQLTGS